MPQASRSHSKDSSVPVSHQAAAELGTTLVRLMKLFQALRQQAPPVHPAIEAGSHPILFTLMEESRRVSALAECVHSDISTVSRQVSHLVSHGLAAKISDPRDGRAQVITLTEQGRDLVSQVRAQRAEWLQRVLQDWRAEEVGELTAYLDRLATAVEAAR
jgi:DNA-binding MarR family transcriptional regulator